MCLLISQPAGHSFTDAWLTDFFTRNNDGIGVMWAENGRLEVRKVIPNNAADVIAFYREHADGKECAIHLRMQTHGDVDLTNCHPYKVFSVDEDGEDLWLMHNGILHTGNSADTTKSDTWHFIEDVVKPALRGRASDYSAPWFKALVEEFIGSGNKFAMMDGSGHVELFNKDEGVMWGDVWMSNTYAWSAAKAGVYSTYDWKSSYGYGSSSWSGSSRWDRDDDDAYTKWWDRKGSDTAPKQSGNVNGNVTPINSRSAKSDDEYAEAAVDFAKSIKEEERADAESLAYDAESWCYSMYDLLDTLDWSEAYRTITEQNFISYYLDDEATAWGLLDAVESGNISETDLIAEMDRFMYQQEDFLHSSSWV